MIASDDMRRRGSISRVTLADGTVKFRVRVIEGKQRKSYGLHDTQEDAERVCSAALAQTYGGGSIALRQWGATYLDLRARDGVHRDERGDRNRWNVVMRAPFADDPLVALHRDAIQDWVNAMVAAGKKKTTISNAVSLLRMALKEAIKQKKLTDNPAAGVEIPRIAETEQKWTWLTQTEIDRLVVALAEPPAAHPKTGSKRRHAAYHHQRTAIVVALYTGLREGELWGLRWADVELDDRPRVTVRRSFRNPTKAGKVREVPLLPPAIEALRQQKRNQPGLPRALVWPADGGGCHAKGYDAQIGKWVAEAGITRKVRFHDLRHTCASHLVQGTWGETLSLYAVRDWLGHADIKTTQRYAHLAPDGLHGWAEKLRASWKVGTMPGQRDNGQ